MYPHISRRMGFITKLKHLNLWRINNLGISIKSPLRSCWIENANNLVRWEDKV